MTGADSDEKAAALRETAPVYAQLTDRKSGAPLGGSFKAGETLLKKSNPEKEADTVLEMRGVEFVYVCGFACLAPGISQSRDARPSGGFQATIPATGDAIGKTNKVYNELAQNFALRFNRRMILKHSMKEAVAREFSEADLSVNGVVAGKSNLFNSIGKFGPNTIHHVADSGGPMDYVCYVGEDGTLLTFESGVGAGRDQTITDVRLMNAQALYPFRDQCQPSKKVNQTLTIYGLSLGQTGEIEKLKGASAGMKDAGDHDIYVFASPGRGKKASIQVTTLELARVDAKISQIEMSRSEVR